MQIIGIELRNFRNYKHLIFKPKEKINIILGENGQGKTNLLEALYMLLSFKSFRSNKISEVLTIGEDSGFIRGRLNSKDNERLIEILIKDRDRKIFINKKPINIEEMKLFTNRAVIFSHRDLDVISGVPQLRRRFIDLFVINLYLPHYDNIRRYFRIMKQRKNLLMNLKHENTINELNVWNYKMAEVAYKIIEKRIFALNKLKNEFQNIYSQLSPNLISFEILYNNTSGINVELKNESEFIEMFTTSIKEQIKEEIKRGIPLIGPHLDDIIFMQDEKDMRIFGSRGYQRKIAFALKISEIMPIYREYGQFPVVLLDDVLSELDYNHKEFLLNFTEGLNQVFISSTGDDILRLKNYSFFQIQDSDIHSKGRNN